MAINLNDMMSRSSGAAQAALGLRYGTVAQPPALNFVQPTLAATATAKSAQKDAVEPITELSMAGMVNATNASLDRLVALATGSAGSTKPTTTGAPK
jgi:hypothetical protein